MPFIWLFNRCHVTPFIDDFHADMPPSIIIIIIFTHYRPPIDLYACMPNAMNQRAKPAPQHITPYAQKGCHYAKSALRIYAITIDIIIYYYICDFKKFHAHITIDAPRALMPQQRRLIIFHCFTPLQHKNIIFTSMIFFKNIDYARNNLQRLMPYRFFIATRYIMCFFFFTVIIIIGRQLVWWRQRHHHRLSPRCAASCRHAISIFISSFSLFIILYHWNTIDLLLLLPLLFITLFIYIIIYWRYRYIRLLLFIYNINADKPCIFEILYWWWWWCIIFVW